MALLKPLEGMLRCAYQVQTCNAPTRPIQLLLTRAIGKSAMGRIYRRGEVV